MLPWQKWRRQVQTTKNKQTNTRSQETGEHLFSPLAEHPDGLNRAVEDAQQLHPDHAENVQRAPTTSLIPSQRLHGV